MSAETKVYTAIPDTSDLSYWQVKIANDVHHSQTFVPRDKELHYRLKVQQRAEIDARLAKLQQQQKNHFGGQW